MSEAQEVRATPHHREGRPLRLRFRASVPPGSESSSAKTEAKPKAEAKPSMSSLKSECARKGIDTTRWQKARR